MNVQSNGAMKSMHRTRPFNSTADLTSNMVSEIMYSLRRNHLNAIMDIHESMDVELEAIYVQGA